MKNVFAKLIHIRKEFEHQVKLLATGDSRRRRGLNPNVTEDENSAKLKRTEAALKNCDRINLKLKRNLNACSNGNKAKKGNFATTNCVGVFVAGIKNLINILLM